MVEITKKQRDRKLGYVSQKRSGKSKSKRFNKNCLI